VFSKETAAFPAFRALDIETMIVERADVVRPSEPPKNKVFFAVSHRGEQTAVSLAYGNPPPKMFILRRVSDGMAQNAALAICTALWLGIPIETIQARLAGWQPAKFRGEIRRIDGRLVYLDCYNANPASMADALATFESITSVDEPRLFVLGCMEELGTEAAAHHHQLGRTLRVGKHDRVFVIGTHAHEVSAGLREADATRPVDVITSLEPVAAFFARWPHAVFVKGSRRYQLEKILQLPVASTLPT
jgi:UDP-N-acetylmuramoyl-tripeptide--D-alanyl-D-alanine ligase